MPIMSRAEQAFCRSAPWNLFARRAVVPWVLRGTTLTGDVLEIGGGSGAMAALVADRCPAARFTVTDLDERMVDAARKTPRVIGWACERTSSRSKRRT